MITQQIKEVHKRKGLNSVYAELRKRKINFTTTVHEFGLDNQTNRANKNRFLTENELAFHYYSVAVKSRKTGFSYNRIRAIVITLC